MNPTTPVPAKKPRASKADIPSQKAQRQKPSPKVQKELHVRAGGRCHICNTYVLESTDLGYYAFNRGEMAHIVGQSLNLISPRSDFPLAKELRDEVDNFLLLCADHHQTIDNTLAQGDFTVELLREIKRQHEDHIRHVTGLPTRTSHTGIVRLVGRIRGYTTQLTRAECNSATIHHTPARFADFALDLRRQGTEIDLVPFGEPEEDIELYYKNVRKRINEGLSLIRQGVEQGLLDHLSVFGFARIPALVCLGFSLGNKIGTTLFQRRRVDADHWHWLPNTPVQTFDWSLMRAGSDTTRVALILNVSGSIHLSELPLHIDDCYSVFLIKTADVAPNPDAILSVASLTEFRQCYRRWLAHLETEHKFAPAIHLFPAVPPAVAIACGLDLMPHTQPALIVYDRMPHDFCFALTVNEQMTSGL
jgi:hypothetical protein